MRFFELVILSINFVTSLKDKDRSETTIGYISAVDDGMRYIIIFMFHSISTHKDFSCGYVVFNGD